MRNDAGWGARTGSKPASAAPKKIDDIVLPFLEKELGIKPEHYDRESDSYSSNAESVVRHSMSEAAKIYLLGSEHSTPLAEQMIGGFKTALMKSAVTDKLYYDDRMMLDHAREKADEIMQRFKTEIQSGLGQGQSKA